MDRCVEVHHQVARGRGAVGKTRRRDGDSSQQGMRLSTHAKKGADMDGGAEAEEVSMFSVREEVGGISCQESCLFLCLCRPLDSSGQFRTSDRPEERCISGFEGWQEQSTVEECVEGRMTSR